jgi:hypothetical protein
MTSVIAVLFRWPWRPFDPNDCTTWPNAFWCPPSQRGLYRSVLR